MTRTHSIVIVAAAALAVGGGGAAVAASQLGSPLAERDAVIADAARELGVAPQALEDALGKALRNRVDAAVEGGRLTEEQGERLEERIRSGELPFLHGPRAGRKLSRQGRFGTLDAASRYLGLAHDELRERLRGGPSLADVAREQGKSVDGLVAALEAELRRELDRAVDGGRLSAERRDAILERLAGRIQALVDGEHRRHFGHRSRGGERPPAWAPGRS